MIILRIKNGFGIYNSGEIAGFEKAEADALVASGVAELVAAGMEVPAATDEPATDAPKPRKPRNS